jgi:hypothetical protein
MTENGNKQFVRSFILPAIELLIVSSLLLAFAFYGRHHLVEGNPRHNFLQLLFFACVFGGVFIVEARLHALFEKRRVFVKATKLQSRLRPSLSEYHGLSNHRG